MATQQTHRFHPLPVIGHPETFYAKHVKEADAAGDVHAHHSYKVGQYITLGLDPKRPWDEKLKYFRHTLKHHCMPPDESDDQVQVFYDRLIEMVRRYASHEALRLARKEHDAYAMRMDL